MATKYSKKKFNNKKLAKGLDDITNKVARRQGYFFTKNNFNFYDVINIVTNKKVLVDIPFQRTASAVTKRLNTKDHAQGVSVDRLQRLCQNFHKHYNDTIFYNHSLDTTKDSFKKQIVISRLDLSIAYLKNIKEDLINY